MISRCHLATPLILIFLASLLSVIAQPYQVQYERPVDVAPTEEDIGEGYEVPPVQRPHPRSAWAEILDVALLLAAMGLAVWIVLVKRRRGWLVVLTIVCLAYFGFYRDGCVCPIGSIQNVAVAFMDPNFVVSYSVIAFFIFPLVLAVLFGRVFCGGVCPLGAIQELVVLKPVHVPRLLDRLLGSLKYIYLSLAILFVVRPEVTRDFLICRLDPFVGFFRFEGPAHMLMIGGAFLVLGMFVGRPFCRYLCPYGVLLSLLSRLSWRGVSITPNRELDCGLCMKACPYGAIENMRAVSSACLFCARCYNACPLHRVDAAPLVKVQPSSDEMTR